MVLLPFVFCSVVAASLEALSFLLLLKIIVPASAPENINLYINFLNRLVNLEEQQINFNTLLGITIFSFSLAIVLGFLISFAEGLINTSLKLDCNLHCLPISLTLIGNSQKFMKSVVWWV